MKRLISAVAVAALIAGCGGGTTVNKTAIWQQALRDARAQVAGEPDPATTSQVQTLARSFYQGGLLVAETCQRDPKFAKRQGMQCH